MKNWGNKEFWGCGSEYDPDWVLTEQQKTLRDKLIELCRTTIRPKAAENDKEYKFPRASLDSLSSLGLLGLLVPKNLGGLGESHVCCAMVVETIARYGCPSTALVYCMHLVATSMLLVRHTTKPTIIQLLKEMNDKKLIGTSVHADPATGGHVWCPMTSKSKLLAEEKIRCLKYGSWATSAGYADWYAASMISPNFAGDYSNKMTMLCFKNEIRAFAGEWSALGMHGNMSGEIIFDATLPADRIVGVPGEGATIDDEGAFPMFLTSTSACWNGIAMACMDVAKKHVTRKNLGDVGMRICDFPSVQDYFGRCLCSTNSCRLALFSLAQQFDVVSDGNDWVKTSNEKIMPRSAYNFWLWQAKHNSSENAGEVADIMLKACGGTGYKTEMGLERLLRDSKAGALMAPNNEVARVVLGQVLLTGPEPEFLSTSPNKRTLHQELSKMTVEDKKALAQSLLTEVAQEEQPVKTKPFDDFDNPFNTSQPAYLGEFFKVNNETMTSALNPSTFTELTLRSTEKVASNMASFLFSLPQAANHSGLLPGQYVNVRIKSEEIGTQERAFSPVSVPEDPDTLELVLRFESYGIVSNYFKNMKPGDHIECKGPCGGFEYQSNTLDELTLLASGGGITPGLQLIRCIMADTADNTKVKLLYYSDTFQDILYREELDEYLAKYPAKFQLIYSLGEVPENWDGEEGFLNEKNIAKHVKENTTPMHKIVVCGGPNMSLTCCYILRTLGFRSEQVFIFGQFGAEQVKTVYGKNCSLAQHTS